MKALKPVLVAALLLIALVPVFGGKAVDGRKDADNYPLKTCVVSGDKLGGDMGAPYVFLYKDPKVKDDPGRVVKLCCKGCLDDFNKEPAKYLKMIDEAAAARSRK